MAKAKNSDQHVCGLACAGGDCYLIADGQAANPVVATLNAVAAATTGSRR